ncbi:cytochrome P450 [Auriscalpium vulgare]|uniref:Cytochrome P450 n=1 Tax=Auriscalpium vulgare TaxID=40419 RepID=A0ACB8RAK4_9AGAM|nr:cytochrome P450 [Auriscalpium vulgare]
MSYILSSVPPQTAFSTLIVALVLAGVLYSSIVGRRKDINPPGPSGNASRELASGQTVAVFNRWRKEYGPIFSFNLGFKKVIVLNNAKATTDLLVKRGDIYSNRPRLVVAHEILSGSMRGLSMQYGDMWKKWRKMQHAGMNGRAALAHREHQSLESTVLLRDLLRTVDVDEHNNLLQRFATSVVLGISYGRRVRNLDDEMVKQNYMALQEYQRANSPGRYLVETWPILLWLPKPLQWFRPPLESIRRKDTNTYLTFFRNVKSRFAAGIAKDCMAVSAIANSKAGSDDLSEVEVAYALSAPFSAGIDTTLATLQYAIVFALLYPEALKKAQVELDAVVGHGRLPTFDDEKSLPYLSAFIKETTRFRPVVPLAVPHAATADNVYEDYNIRKGTVVYGNIDALCRDSTAFSNPEVFTPERFLITSEAGQDKIDPRYVDFNLPFGFGRRICPGMQVALQSSLFWAFDILPPASGILPDPDKYTNVGLTRGPEPFNYRVRPRHVDVAKILEEEGAEADVRLKEWEY